MKFFNLILLALVVTSCSTARKVTSHQPTIVEPIEVVSEPVIEDKNTLKVLKFINFKQSEINEFWLVAAKIDKTINSQCFESHFLSQEKLTKTNDLSRSEVIHDLRTTKPVVSFQMYYKRGSTVGYTYPNVNTIWMNRKFHNKMSRCLRAGNISHELSHKRGYGHSSKNHYDRKYSVPYTMNSGFKRCCR